MPTPHYDPRVDAYINKAQPFAQPILVHLRGLLHKGCPQVQETIKWSRPFFEFQGAILCNISAFKAHCSLGFWGEEIGAVLREANVVQDGGLGSLGRITTLADLPSDKLMLGWIRQATAFIADGSYTSPIAARQKVVKAPRSVAEVPPELAAALEKNKPAARIFAAFSPSCQREYVEWVAEAKRPETRDKRIAQAVEQIAEGKQRNWKYQNC